MKIYSNFKKISFIDKENIFNVQTNKKIILCDYIIDATGTPSSINKLDSALIRNLQASGMIEQHEFGGVNFDFNNHQLQNHHNIFVIGHLTFGVKFYIGAIERLLIHADKIARELIKDR